MKRVLFADTGSMTLGQTRRAVSSASDIDAVTYTYSMEDACAGIMEVVPDVVVVESTLPSLDICRLARATADQQTGHGGLLIVSPEASRADVGRLLSRGARGFVFHTSPAEEVITAIRAVALGRYFVPALFLTDLSTILTSSLCARESTSGHFASLTRREIGVLRLLAHGYSNGGIAAALYITPATVRSHLLSIFRKLNVRNRAQAVVMAFQQGLVAPVSTAPDAVPPTSVRRDVS